APVDVESVDPRTRLVGSGDQVEERRAIEEGGVAQPRVVKGDPLRRSSGGSDPPDVHLVGRVPLHEVDEFTVWRPGLEVGVPWSSRAIERPGLARCGLDEHRVAGCRGVQGNAYPVGGPGELRNLLERESRLVARDGDHPGADWAPG